MSNEYVAHEETIGKVTIKIIPDSDPAINPIKDWDMLGTQVYWHRNYNLGHVPEETSRLNPTEWLADKVGDYLGVNNWDVYSKKYEEWEYKSQYDRDYLMEKFGEYNLVIPVYAYEHGGITFFHDTLEPITKIISMLVGQVGIYLFVMDWNNE